MIFQIVGWTGAALVLAAYILVSFDKIEGESTAFGLLNFFGGAGLGVVAYSTRTWPVLALECAWALIALASLVGGVLRRRWGNKG